MCELFGFCSAKSYDLTEWLREFYSHSVRHPDGWGIAFFGDHSVSIEKEPVAAGDSERLREILSEPVCAPLLLAHIRKASVGSLKYENSHPFVKKDAGGRNWTLIHNGTVFQSQILEKYTEIQEGSTDSERILLYIVDEIDRLEKSLGRAASDRERFDSVEDSVANVAPGNKMNLILYDGDLFYIHANMKSSLRYLQLPDAVAVSTEALSEKEPWREVPLSTLMAFRGGKEIFRGADMHHVYVDPSEEEKSEAG